jgi:serine phosphatase RsbU (regulator of sigma subunit)
MQRQAGELHDDPHADLPGFRMDLRPAVGEPAPQVPAPRDPAERAARRASALGTAMVVLVGLLATVLLVVASSTAHDNNEERLLEQRTREAAAVLTNALPAVQTPLASAAALADATGGDTEVFREFFSPEVGPEARFDAAALWPASADAARPTGQLGDVIALAAEDPAVIRAALERSLAAPGVVIVDLLHLPEPRVGYLVRTSAEPDFIAYGESVLPATRTQQERSDSAFEGLDYALYLGAEQTDETLLIASTDALPLGEPRATEPVPFGNDQFQIVMTPRASLGGDLMAALPWIIAAVGAVLTAIAAVVMRRLMARRFQADQLSNANRELYENQLDVATTLRRSLLPDRLPALVPLDVAARYEAGVQGVEIGGDWYDLMELDDGTLLFVVGDVSGRGLGAAATMASLRFSARAYAQEGHAPDEILARLSGLLDVERDGHFATQLCVRVDVERRELRIASAGHPSPVLLEGARARLVDVQPGVPVGLPSGERYEVVTVEAAAGATFLAFTDGLFERRGEGIDAGLERVRGSVERHGGAALEEMLDLLTGELLAGTEDDTALLALRWRSTDA